jgi:hypothetical protein
MKLGLVLVPAALSVAALHGTETPELVLESCWVELSRAEERPPECFLELARPLAATILGERFRIATERERLRFTSALAPALRRALPEGADPVLRSRASEADSVRLEYRVGDRSDATVLLRTANPGGLHIQDVLWNGASLSARLRRECERSLERYSFAYLVSEISGSGVVVLEDFEDAPPGEPPLGWKRRPFRSEVRTTPYRVLSEGDNRFLRAEDRGENVMLYKEIRWDAKKYPYLAWRWRIRAVPQGADERVEDRADSAAGLYLSYGRRLGIVPQTVKFVWSGSLAAGSAFRRPGIGMPWTVIVDSGGPQPDLWQSFVFHSGDVYRKTFASDPGDRPLGIGVLSDADSTRGFAAADYDDIVALVRPRPDDRVLEVVSVSTN